MSNSLSRPYAEAVFALAKDSKTWQDLLHNLAAIMQDSKMQELVTNPNIEEKSLAELFQNILQLTDKQQQQFVALVIENKRMPLVSSILQQYLDLCNDANKVELATITSAHALSETQKQNIVSALASKTGTEIKAEFIINSELIGGLIIKVKDKIIDKSISGMLTQMKNQMTQTKDISYAT